MRTGVCPQCKETSVTTQKRLGSFPRCSGCLEKNKRGRYDRRNASKDSRYTHYDKDGVRYGNKFTKKEQICGYCNNLFVSKRKPNGKPVCDSCIPVAKEAARVRRLQTITNLYWKNPEIAKRKRLSLTLALRGLSIEWYDSQPKKCGICGTDDPGKKGWCIDHNHSCCGYGIRKGCKKCIRGLLCSNCNIGLGQFKDNPDFLRKAIKWVEDHPLG